MLYFFITASAGTGQFAGPVVRLHIGLEDVEDLTNDLDQALAAMRTFGK
jgi:cystathionine beta-lyase/cystathionine gamma-synthase